MTMASQTIILDRISVAPPESPIAVFRAANRADCMLDAVFANTVQTQRRIHGADPNLVGVYHHRMRLTRVRDDLMRATKRRDAQWH